MAKLTTAEFIEAIKELSVLELNELVKACEEEFGVSAAAGVVVAAAGDAAGAAEEKRRVLRTFQKEKEKPTAACTSPDERRKPERFCDTGQYKRQ